MSKTNNGKKLAYGAIAIGLIMSVAVAFTIAYLFDKTEPVVNKLTFVGTEDNSLSGELKEVWNPADGLDLLPGSVVTKKPRIENTSKADASEWVAIQVVFEKINGTTNTAMNSAELQKVLSIMSIDFDTADWESEVVAPGINGVRYYYKHELKKGEATKDLFTKVSISQDADNDDVNEIAAFARDGINIRLEGAVIQYKHLTYSDAKTELNKLLPRS